MLSGSRTPSRRSWMKPRELRMREAALGSWEPREGVGSSLKEVARADEA